jgi:ATP-binding cassette subfamily B protein
MAAGLRRFSDASSLSPGNMSTATSRFRNLRQIVQLLQSVSDRSILFLCLGGVLAVVVGGALAALTPLVLKSLVDSVATVQATNLRGSKTPVLTEAATYVLLLLAGRGLADVRPLLTGTIDQRLQSRLSQRFLDHTLRLPMSYLISRKGGELLHCLHLATAGAQVVVNHLVGTLLPVVVEVITMTAVLVHLGEPALVGVFGVAALVYLVIFSTGARRMATASREVAASSLEVYAQLNGALTHFETLRYFAAEEQATRRFRGASVILEGCWWRLNLLNVRIALAASLTFAIATTACMGIGASAVAHGAMTLGGFVLINVYMLQMVRPLESLGAAARDLSKAVGYMRPFLELLMVAPVAPAIGLDRSASIPSQERSKIPSVRIENLHFGYDPERSVLKGIDLEIPAGTMTAIVGRSGSGKSSLARLLLGLYVPQTGRILFDGKPIDAIAAADLRGSLVGLVPQETALLHESIAGNIALGRPHATPEDILLAAHGAQLLELLATLPNGLDTPVGDRGMQLSGGERQRVGIARALLRKPGMYVLDEPTSMLDTSTELGILNALGSLAMGATRVVIAHRLSTIVNADQIIVLDDGQICERGNHRALLEMDGVYAQMWRQQTAGCV